MSLASSLGPNSSPRELSNYHLRRLERGGDVIQNDAINALTALADVNAGWIAESAALTIWGRYKDKAASREVRSRCLIFCANHCTGFEQIESKLALEFKRVDHWKSAEDRAWFVYGIERANHFQKNISALSPFGNLLADLFNAEHVELVGLPALCFMRYARAPDSNADNDLARMVGHVSKLEQIIRCLQEQKINFGDISKRLSDAPDGHGALHILNLFRQIIDLSISPDELGIPSPPPSTDKKSSQGVERDSCQFNAGAQRQIEGLILRSNTPAEYLSGLFANGHKIVCLYLSLNSEETEKAALKTICELAASRACSHVAIRFPENRRKALAQIYDAYIRDSGDDLDLENSLSMDDADKMLDGMSIKRAIPESDLTRDDLGLLYIGEEVHACWRVHSLAGPLVAALTESKLNTILYGLDITEVRMAQLGRELAEHQHALNLRNALVDSPGVRVLVVDYLYDSARGEGAIRTFAERLAADITGKPVPSVCWLDGEWMKEQHRRSNLAEIFYEAKSQPDGTSITDLRSDPWVREFALDIAGTPLARVPTWQGFGPMDITLGDEFHGLIVSPYDPGYTQFQPWREQVEQGALTSLSDVFTQKASSVLKISQ